MSTWSRHWPEYLIEAACLAAFMVSAAGFATLLQHPASPVPGWVTSPVARRVLMGAAMGLTAVALIYSPLGQRSGAHMNPAVTLTYLRLGRIAPADAAGYVLAQFVGGTIGILAATRFFGGLPAEPPINYVATLPGSAGPLAAFGGELLISFLLMAAILVVSNVPRVARFTGLVAGALVWTWIVTEEPLSGMSMNPARSFGANLLADGASTLWIYFVAPAVGMLVAAELTRRWRRLPVVRCAKLHHTDRVRCHFRCGFAALEETTR